MIDQGAFAGMRAIGLRDGALCEMSPQHRPHLVGEAALFNGLRNALPMPRSPPALAACVRPESKRPVFCGLVKPVAVVAETPLNGAFAVTARSPVPDASRNTDW